jgi:hypothetical protein
MTNSVINITPSPRDRGERLGVRGQRSNRTAYPLTPALSPFSEGEGNKYA